MLAFPITVEIEASGDWQDLAPVIISAADEASIDDDSEAGGEHGRYYRVLLAE